MTDLNAGRAPSMLMDADPGRRQGGIPEKDMAPSKPGRLSVRFNIGMILVFSVLFVPLSSLADWSRIDGVSHFRVVIDHTRIDQNLTDFPVLIHLSESCGIGDFDASLLFDELPFHADRKKIAFYTADGSRCPAEIERWKAEGKEAWIWVRVPVILADWDTEFLLFYDGRKEDNSRDIGDTGETAARSVWDDRFVGVWHMEGDPSLGSACIPDATVNELDGLPAGAFICGDPVDETIGEMIGGTIGAAVEFSGRTRERIDIQLDASFDLSHHTIESRIRPYSHAADQGIIDVFNADAASILGMGTKAFGEPVWSAYSSFDGRPLDSAADIIRGGTVPVGQWTHLTYTFDGMFQRIYENGRPVGFKDQAGRSPLDPAVNLMIGNRLGGMQPFNGVIDEVRISDVSRSGAWVRAAYHAGMDDLVRFVPPLSASAVTSLMVNVQENGTTALLDWSGYDAERHGVVSFRIYVETSFFADISGLTPRDTVDASISTYEVTGLAPGMEYYFAVVPVDAAGHPLATIAAAVLAETKVLLKIDIALPTAVIEGGRIISGEGSVSIPMPPDADLVIDLSSSRPSILSVPATVTIPAGHTSAKFDLTVFDHSILTEKRSVTISGSAEGWQAGSAVIGIWDNGRNFLVENFSGNDNDLANKTLTCIPVGTGGTYSACIRDAEAFPVDPSGGTTLRLRDDTYAEVSLSNGVAIPFFGTTYSSFYIGSNGYITFGVRKGDSDYTPSIRDHYNRPRISGLFADLWPPRGGTLTWQQLDDRAVVTYQNIPQYNKTYATNSFQIEMFFNGTIRITWLNIGTRSGLVGLSDGSGIPADFVESDLSACECEHESVPEIEICFSSDSYTAAENLGPAEVTVRLSGESRETVTVDYALSPGTAAAGSDYSDASGTLAFAPGETTKTITVPIADDDVYEADETVIVMLTHGINAALGAPVMTVLTIVNDDPDDIPPEISKLRMGKIELKDGCMIFTRKTITLQADDRSGIDRVEFFLDGKLFHSDGDGTDDYSGELDTTIVPYGDHMLSMAAYDAAGNRTSAQYAIASSPGLPFPCFAECAR